MERMMANDGNEVRGSTTITVELIFNREQRWGFRVEHVPHILYNRLVEECLSRWPNKHEDSFPKQAKLGRQFYNDTIIPFMRREVQRLAASSTGVTNTTLAFFLFSLGRYTRAHTPSLSVFAGAL